MRPTARKFHFLKAETIVVDRTALHKGHFPQQSNPMNPFLSSSGRQSRRYHNLSAENRALGERAIIDVWPNAVSLHTPPTCSTMSSHRLSAPSGPSGTR